MGLTRDDQGLERVQEANLHPSLFAAESRGFERTTRRYGSNTTGSRRAAPPWCARFAPACTSNSQADFLTTPPASNGGPRRALLLVRVRHLVVRVHLHLEPERADTGQPAHSGCTVYHQHERRRQQLERRWAAGPDVPPQLTFLERLRRLGAQQSAHKARPGRERLPALDWRDARFVHSSGPGRAGQLGDAARHAQGCVSLLHRPNFTHSLSCSTQRSRCSTRTLADPVYLPSQAQSEGSSRQPTRSASRARRSSISSEEPRATSTSSSVVAPLPCSRST